MESGTKQYSERTYSANEVCIFNKTKENYGGLSNMAAGYKLKINGYLVPSTEALYQACRFPHLPEVQKTIIAQASPMAAKMKSKPHRAQSRPDWEDIKIKVMRWCLRVKLAQHFVSFGRLLESTSPYPIVEESHKDRFWGAVRTYKGSPQLQGVNALGRLLMALREQYQSEYRYDLLYVPPPEVENFLFLGQPIQAVDERAEFIHFLINSWNRNSGKNEEKIYPPEMLRTLLPVPAGFAAKK